MATKECVVHIVSFDIVNQMNMASSEYPPEVSEFEKAGFTLMPSLKVTPPRAKESPVHLECKLMQMIHLGDQPGSGNLAICEIVMIHMNENIFNSDQKIDVQKINHVARNGESYYTHVIPESLFELKKP